MLHKGLREERGGSDPLPFHRHMQWLFIELIFGGEVRHSLKDTSLSMESTKETGG